MRGQVKIKKKIRKYKNAVQPKARNYKIKRGYSFYSNPLKTWSHLFMYPIDGKN